jgi:hypothetical protein
LALYPLKSAFLFINKKAHKMNLKEKIVKIKRMSNDIFIKDLNSKIKTLENVCISQAKKGEDNFYYFAVYLKYKEYELQAVKLYFELEGIQADIIGDGMFNKVILSW